MIYILVALALIIFSISYFAIAKKYSLIDFPNYRSSHARPTVTGGGIVFPVSIIFWWCLHDFQYPVFILGLVIIGVVSFADDVKSLSVLARVPIQIFCVLLLCYEVNLHNYDWIYLILSVIVLTAFINAYNFMDGISGITGGYSLLTFSTLLYINESQMHFIDNSIIYFSMIAIIVFLFFNFRRHAKWFAGDVGSFTIAYTLAFLTLHLILKTGQFAYLLLFLLYGIDTFFTILQRLLQKENIFLPHRKHLYQYLSNEGRFSQLIVSLMYILCQGLMNILFLRYLHNSLIILVIAACIATAYIYLKSYVYKRYITDK